MAERRVVDVPISPHISPYIPISRHISPYLPMQSVASPYPPRHISPYLPMSRHISPERRLARSPHISPYLPISRLVERDVDGDNLTDTTKPTQRALRHRADGGGGDHAADPCGRASSAVQSTGQAAAPTVPAAQTEYASDGSSTAHATRSPAAKRRGLAAGLAAGGGRQYEVHSSPS